MLLRKRCRRLPGPIQLTSVSQRCLLCLTALSSERCLIGLQELEGEGNLRQAEHHYVEAGDWKAAVNMYRGQDQWDESYRVSFFLLLSFLFFSVH